jgi:hypothetical protein
MLTTLICGYVSRHLNRHRSHQPFFHPILQLSLPCVCTFHNALDHCMFLAGALQFTPSHHMNALVPESGPTSIHLHPGPSLFLFPRTLAPAPSSKDPAPWSLPTSSLTTPTITGLVPPPRARWPTTLGERRRQSVVHIPRCVAFPGSPFLSLSFRANVPLFHLTRVGTSRLLGRAPLSTYTTSRATDALSTAQLAASTIGRHAATTPSPTARTSS